VLTGADLMSDAYCFIAQLLPLQQSQSQQLSAVAFA
jgi:hypothetical protein